MSKLGSFANFIGANTGTYLNANNTADASGPTPGGPAGGDLSGFYPDPTLAIIGAGGGPIGNATNVAQITYDTKGRITAASVVPITFPAPMITTQEEGVTLSSAVTTLNFVGAGVTASGAGATTTVTIPSGVPVLDANATPTAPASGDTKGVWYGLNTKANAFDSTCVTLGVNADTGAGSAVAVGNTAAATGSGSVVVGSSSTASGTNGVCVGSASTATGNFATVCGEASTANGLAATALGAGAAATGQDALAIGDGATASITTATAMGRVAIASAAQALAIGDGAQATTGAGATAIGAGARAFNTNAVGIGGGCLANNLESVAVGRFANAGGDYAVAIGASSVADTSAGVALGAAATLNAITESMCLNATATGGMSPLDTAHAFALAVNSLSRNPGSFGVTVNAAIYQLPLYTSLFSTTPTAAGVTTLTVTSAKMQYFTGATTQTVTLPVVTTLANGFEFKIANLSTGAVTVQSSGGDPVGTLAGATAPTAKWGFFTCINTGGGTGTASWSYEPGA